MENKDLEKRTETSVNVYWEYGIHRGIKEETDEELLKVTLNMYEIYKGNDKQLKEELFGKGEHEDYPRLMGTITPLDSCFRGKEGDLALRVWCGIPSDIGRTHADSCGKNLVLQVTGNARTVREYQEALLPGYARGPYIEGKLLNEVTVILPGRLY